MPGYCAFVQAATATTTRTTTMAKALAKTDDGRRNCGNYNCRRTWTAAAVAVAMAALAALPATAAPPAAAVWLWHQRNRSCSILALAQDNYMLPKTHAQQQQQQQLPGCILFLRFYLSKLPATLRTVTDWMIDSLTAWLSEFQLDWMTDCLTVASAPAPVATPIAICFCCCCLRIKAKNMPKRLRAGVLAERISDRTTIMMITAKLWCPGECRARLGQRKCSTRFNRSWQQHHQATRLVEGTRQLYLA